MLDAVIATIRGSDDRPAALEALQAAPFEFSEEQANHILDMTLARLTRLGRTKLEEEMAKLLEEIAELESILSDPAKLRGVIADGAGRDPGEVRQRPADRDHPRPRRHERGGSRRRRGARRHHEPGRLRQGGVRRRLPDPGSGRPGCAGGQAEGGGSDRRRGPHDGARAPPAVLQSGPGVPPAGPRDPDEGTHGAGDRHRQPVPAGPQRGIQAIVETRDFSADSYLVFAPSWVRSRRRRSASTTSPAGRDSSPSTCARATNWCGWSRPMATTTCSWSPSRG